MESGLAGLGRLHGGSCLHLVTKPWRQIARTKALSLILYRRSERTKERKRSYRLVQVSRQGVGRAATRW